MEKTILNRRIDSATDTKLAIPVDHECGIPKNVEFTVTAESTNRRDVKVRLSTINYQNIKKDSVLVDVYLSRTRKGEPITSAAPTFTVITGTRQKVWAEVGGTPVFFQMKPTDLGRFELAIQTTELETFYLIVVLPDGTIACSNAINFADTDAPVVTIGTPSDSDPVNGTQALTYGVTGTHVAEEARIGSAAWAAVVSGALVNTLSGWGAAPQGAMVIQVRAVDASGNIGLDSVSVVKDTIAPVVAITAPLDGAFVKGDALLTFTLTGGPADVDARIGTGTWTAVTSGVTTMADIGGWGDAVDGDPFSLQLKATDLAGNEGLDDTDPVKDITVPSLSVTVPATATSYASTTLLDFLASDLVSGVTVYARVNGAGAWSGALTTGVNALSDVGGWSGLAEDDICTVNFRAVDGAGNETLVDVTNVTKHDGP